MSSRNESPRTFKLRRLPALALIVTVGLASSWSARAAEPLTWKFKEGEVIRYKLVQKTETKMKAGGREGGSKVEQISDVRWNVKAVSPEGLAQMTQTIDRVQVTMDTPGQPQFKFDSDAKDAPQEGQLAAQLAPMFKALAGFECSLTMDSRGRIDNIKIPKETIDALRGSLLGQATNLFTEEGMKNMIGQSSLVLPATAEETLPGKSWTDHAKVPVANLGTILTEKTYTVEGPDKENADLTAIALTSKMTIEPNENAGVHLEITNQKNEGRFLFDSKNGRIAKSHVVADMTQLIMAGDQNLEQTVGNTLEMTLVPEGQPAKAEGQPAQTEAQPEKSK